MGMYLVFFNLLTFCTDGVLAACLCMYGMTPDGVYT